MKLVVMATGEMTLKCPQFYFAVCGHKNATGTGNLDNNDNDGHIGMVTILDANLTLTLGGQSGQT